MSNMLGWIIFGLLVGILLVLALGMLFSWLLLIVFSLLYESIKGLWNGFNKRRNK